MISYVVEKELKDVDYLPENILKALKTAVDKKEITDDILQITVGDEKAKYGDVTFVLNHMTMSKVISLE